MDVNFLNSLEQSALILTMNNESIHANTPIILAMDKGCMNHVKKLIQAGADVNAQVTGTSILYFAVHKGSIDIVETLINVGADVNLKTIQGCTALMRAVRNDEMICMQMLLKAGTKVRQYDVQGLNTFYFLKSPSADICNILYSAGEDYMMAGGASRIVGMENPKIILDEEYSEPLFLMKNVGTKFGDMCCKSTQTKIFFTRFLNYQYQPKLLNYFCSILP